MTGIAAVACVGAELSGRLESVQVAHAEIHEDDIWPMGAAELDGLEAASRGDHAHPGALEQAGEDPPVHRTVVGDERGQQFARREARVRRERLAIASTGTAVTTSSDSTSGSSK